MRPTALAPLLSVTTEYLCMAWSVSHLLEQTQPKARTRACMLSPSMLLLPHELLGWGTFSNFKAHSCMDKEQQSWDAVAPCATEATGPGLLPMWCNDPSSLPATPSSQLPKRHVCREWQSFCHQGKRKTLASHCIESQYGPGKWKADRPHPTNSSTEQRSPVISNAEIRQAFQFSSAPN